MSLFVLIVLFASTKSITSQTWNMSDGIHPWEDYIKLVNIQRPLGITLNSSSLVHHHFAIGYLCFHSSMYDEAQEAFNLAIELDSKFIEAYIGKMLACKNILTNETDISCGRAVYDTIQTTNVTLTSLQSALINAVYQWFTNELLIFAGERAFLSSIANISTIYPDETDIHTLWGLALLNVAFQNDYDGQLEPEPMLKAREVLKSVLTIEPNHPGAIQYLIRCYDIAQINIAQQAVSYITSYQNLDLTLPYAHHLPAQIWLRIGDMIQAKAADDKSVRTSFILCSIKQLKKIVSISSTELNDYLAQFNTPDEISTFLKCDDDVRALAIEWLSNTRLQTGNWIGTIQTAADLYTAYNLSNPMSYLYLAAAYRTRARTLTSIFYWLPYDIQFINRAEEINKLDEAIPLISLGDNTTNWSYAWSEAGYRFSECIRILTRNYTSYSDPTTKTRIDTHIDRLSHLADQTLLMNRYVSTSIYLMLPFIQGIIYYKNASYQQCLNVLNNATQIEFNLVLDNNSPTLIYARASELLAIHLLLIHRIYQQESKPLDTIIFNLNGSQISVSNFPQRALELYRQANLSAPNRAVNILGTARAYSQMQYNSEAVKFYQILINQITSTNTSDPIFSQEANDFISKYENIQNYGNKKQIYFSTFFLIILVSIFNL